MNRIKLQNKRAVTLLSPQASLGEALQVLTQTDDPALPVIGDDGFAGVVTREDLLRYAPSPATSLSKWELNYLLNDISINEERLIRRVPAIEATAVLEEAVEAFHGHDTPVIAVTTQGRFSHLYGLRDLVEELWRAQQTAEIRELVRV